MEKDKIVIQLDVLNKLRHIPVMINGIQKSVVMYSEIIEEMKPLKNALKTENLVYFNGKTITIKKRNSSR